jgi:hypothetical protein
MKCKNVSLEFRVGEKLQNLIVWTCTENTVKQMDTISVSMNTIWETWEGEIENMIARK